LRQSPRLPDIAERGVRHGKIVRMPFELARSAAKV
jgi:hypothetical protein